MKEKGEESQDVREKMTGEKSNYTIKKWYVKLDSHKQEIKTKA